MGYESIEVGDIVQIETSDAQFPTYREWIIKFAHQYYYLWKYDDSNSVLEDGSQYIVLFKHEHLVNPIYGMLYLVQNINTKQVHIISQRGIKLYAKALIEDIPVNEIDLRFDGIL